MCSSPKVRSRNDGHPNGVDHPHSLVVLHGPTIEVYINVTPSRLATACRYGVAYGYRSTRRGNVQMYIKPCK